MANAQSLNHAGTGESLAAPFQPNHWRGWLRLLFEAIGYSLLIALLLAGSVLMGAALTHAKTRPQTNAAELTPPSMQAPDGAALVFRTETGLIAAPLQKSQVTLQVTGHIVRAKVSQTYTNPGADWLNAIYQFPLPEDSAVDTLRMKAGNRTIVGEIKPRAKARASFERARAAGKRASLIEQQRPNVFTANIANVAPNADITIDIEYQQALALTESGWALRFPTVVAPRYSPRNHSEALPVALSSDQALPPQPLLLEPDSDQNRLQLEVIVDAGVPVSVPVSATHNIAVTQVNGEVASYRVQLSSEALADRDFELTWAPKPNAEPQASLQMEQHGSDWFGLLTVAPPALNEQTTIGRPREIVLVLDTSGSMHGTLDEAKAAIAYALQQLQPADRFNIIEFNSSHSSLFRESRLATPRNLQTATRFLTALKSTGGTEMRGALLEALKPSIPADMFSQVVFVTDGAVGNEVELFNLIETMLGERKLFTVGIGSAPNSFFMRKAAAAGRGSFTLINQGSEVASRMKTLLGRLASPMLTDLKMRDQAGQLVESGDAIRDLYAGEPIVHVLRLPSLPEHLVIEGEQNEFAWQQPIQVKVVQGRGIDRLWARGEIDTLADQIRRFAHEGRDPQLLRDQATDVAMNHHLVSAYTSLVAIDTTPVRPADQSAEDRAIPRHLPKGWNARALLGANAAGAPLAQTSNGLWWQLATGALLLLLATGFLAVFLFRAQSLLDQNTRLSDQA